MAKELKHYGLATIRRPAKNEFVATTAAVLKDGINASHYCYVQFSPSFVTAVGKRLPQGVSPHNPAYLSIEHRAGEWEIWARYAVSRTGVMLWKQATLPEWVKAFKVKRR